MALDISVAELSLRTRSEHIGLHKRQPRFADPAAFIDLPRSATAYFGNSSRSFFSRWTSVVNCSGSSFAKSS